MKALYKPGDKVWVGKGIRVIAKNDALKCQKCNGHKKLGVLNEAGKLKWVECWSCCGTGQHRGKRPDHVWVFLVEQRTVKKVEVVKCLEKTQHTKGKYKITNTEVEYVMHPTNADRRRNLGGFYTYRKSADRVWSSEAAAKRGIKDGGHVLFDPTKHTRIQK